MAMYYAVIALITVSVIHVESWWAPAAVTTALIDFAPDPAGERVRTRTQQLLKIRYEENSGRYRAQRLIDVRWKYEETYFFEVGYLTGEIIDRYRIMVDLLKRSERYKSDNIGLALKRVEWMEKLWFEVSHLTQMLSQVPKKYNQAPRLASEPPKSTTSTKTKPKTYADEVAEDYNEDEAEESKEVTSEVEKSEEVEPPLELTPPPPQSVSPLLSLSTTTAVITTALIPTTHSRRTTTKRVGIRMPITTMNKTSIWKKLEQHGFLEQATEKPKKQPNKPERMHPHIYGWDLNEYNWQHFLDEKDLTSVL